MPIPHVTYTADNEPIHFSMLENGLDFISSGLRYISEGGTKSDLKYAVLHLSSGIELLMKQRLASEDWRLLFPKPEKAIEAAFKSGSFKSITFDVCLERLQENTIANLPDQEVLTAFRHRRNRFEHFHVKESREALESASIDVLGTILDFIANEFDQSNFSIDEKTLLGDIRTRLTAFEAFRDQRLTEIQPQLAQWRAGSGHIVKCPCCTEEALKADCDVVCAFCGYTARAREAAELYVANTIGGSRSYYEKESGVYPVRACPNCEHATLVYEEDYSETAGICFACGYRPDPGDLMSCGTCGELCSSEDQVGGMCSDCFWAYVAEHHR